MPAPRRGAPAGAADLIAAASLLATTGVHESPHLVSSAAQPYLCVEEMPRDPSKEYVEEVIGRRVRSGIVEYKLKWFEYPYNQATWCAAHTPCRPDILCRARPDAPASMCCAGTRRRRRVTSTAPTN